MTESVEEPSSDQPIYEKEVSIYTKETLGKIKVFREARSGWVTSKNITQTTNNNVKEGAYTSELLYHGRCVCLTKLGFKTNRLRNHYKTLRPLKCFTLKRKLSRYDMLEEKDKIEDVENQLAPSTILPKEIQPEESKTAKSTTSATITETGRLETIEEDEETTYKKKKKKTRKKEEKQTEPKEKKTFKKLKPSKKALENLKAAKKQEPRVLKPCKCVDGKEVTVVIKGFCPCDKLNLNKLKLNKVCDELCEKPAKPIRPPLVTDSVELYKKRFSQKSENDRGDEKSEGKTSEDVKKSIEDKLVKNVSFKGMIDVQTSKETVVIKKSESLITLFRNKQAKKSEMALTKEQFEKMKEASRKTSSQIEG